MRSSNLTIQPTPTSTLFPYTTLFRSPPDRMRGTPGLAHRVAGPLRPDRKSTRLNSSHQIISYAVFCLKKNNAQSWELQAQYARGCSSIRGTCPNQVEV